MKLKIKLLDWEYEFEQNQETGELIVLSTSRIANFAQQSMVEKAVGYAKAEVSRVVQGPVSLDVVGQRKEACDGCEGVDKRSEGEWYCNKCGCPKWGRSQLQVKWEMPAATCPLGKWPK
jgi:hypothetical protein